MLMPHIDSKYINNNSKRILNGFTLIELLIVVGIIAIMASLIIAVIDPVQLRRSAQDTNRQKDLGIISSALEQYYADNNSYPDADLNWSCLENLLVNGWDDCSTNASKPRYIKALPDSQPVDEATQYCYTVDAVLQNYSLCAPYQQETDIGSNFLETYTASCQPSMDSGTFGDGNDYIGYCVENPF